MVTVTIGNLVIKMSDNTYLKYSYALRIARIAKIQISEDWRILQQHKKNEKMIKRLIKTNKR